MSTHNISFDGEMCKIRGIKHNFPFINIHKVPMEVLKTEGEARDFQPSRGTLRMLMNDKIMFDRYYCINSANHCQNEENIGALYFITSSNFKTCARPEIEPANYQTQAEMCYQLC